MQRTVEETNVEKHHAMRERRIRQTMPNGTVYKMMSRSGHGQKETRKKRKAISVTNNQARQRHTQSNKEVVRALSSPKMACRDGRNIH